MSLQVWLPLNKDLNNSGTNGAAVTNTNASLTTAGKIGGCYRFNKNAYLTLPASTITKFTECTVSLWLKINSFNGSYDTYFQLGTGATPWTAYTMGLLRNNANSNLTFCITNGSSSSQNSFTTPNLTAGVWYNITCVYKSGHCLIYINGALHADNTTTIIPNFSAVTTVTIGGLSSNYKTDSFINDFRIYDTALSAKEIKEISKGLMIHYPLDFGGRGQDNLADFQSVTSKWTNDGLSSVTNYADSEHGNVLKLVNATANTRIYRSVSNVWKSGQVYTVSFLARATTNGIVCNMSRSIADFSSNFTLTTEWKKYVGTITSTATADGGTLSFRVVTATAELYITNIKLENGNVCTPYIPGVNDPNYATMGYNNTEYDTSGYKYNGTHTSVTVLNDSPRGSVSSNYGVAASVTSITNSWALNDLIPELTIAIWFKTNTMNSTAPNWFSLGQNSFIRARIASATSVWAYYNVNGTMKSSTYTTKTLTDNVWHHYAITFKSGVERVYIDGAQVGTTDSSGTGTVLKMGANTWNLAGYTASSEKFIGALSDFRIYGSALSADDIKELYQIPVSIDNTGVIYATEINEN